MIYRPPKDDYEYQMKHNILRFATRTQMRDNSLVLRLIMMRWWRMASSNDLELCVYLYNEGKGLQFVTCE